MLSNRLHARIRHHWWTGLYIGPAGIIRWKCCGAPVTLPPERYVE